MEEEELSLKEIAKKILECIEELQDLHAEVEERIAITEEGCGKQYSEKELIFPFGGEKDEDELMVEADGKTYVEGVLRHTEPAE